MSTAGYQLLWAIIKHKKLTEFNNLPSQLFSKDRHGDAPSEAELHTFIRNHKLTYRELPSPETLAQGGFEYQDLDQKYEYYYTRVVNRAIRTKTIQLKDELVKAIQNEKDFTNIPKKVTEFLSQVNYSNTSNKVKTLVAIAEEYKQDLEHSKVAPVNKTVSFGWPTLDKVSGGGMLGGDVIYMVARPGQGKSSLIGASAYQAYINGAKPLIFSMEMMDKNFAARIIANAAKFNPNALRTLSADFFVEKKLDAFIEEHKQKQDFYIAQGAFRQTPDTISSLIDNLKPDVVYIDASYLVSPNMSSKAKWERLSEVGEDLKKIALDYNIPIFQTVQFNRDAGKKNSYELENIAGGDFIGQLGSIVISVQRGDGIHEETRRKLRVIKNRDGDQAEFEINFSFSPPDFTQVTEEQEKEQDELFDEGFQL